MRLLTCLAPGIPERLFRALAAVVGGDLVVDRSRSGPDALADPFRSGAVDLGWICSTSYAALATGPDRSVKLVGVGWVPDDPDARGHDRGQ